VSSIANARKLRNGRRANPPGGFTYRQRRWANIRRSRGATGCNLPPVRSARCCVPSFCGFTAGPYQCNWRRRELGALEVEQHSRSRGESLKTAEGH
jgi:hypothetical protein